MTSGEAQQLRSMVEHYVAAHPERAELDGNQLVLKPERNLKSRAFEYGALKGLGGLQTLEPVFGAMIWCFNPAARSIQPPGP